MPKQQPSKRCLSVDVNKHGKAQVLMPEFKKPCDLSIPVCVHTYTYAVSLSGSSFQLHFKVLGNLGRKDYSSWSGSDLITLVL